MTNVTPAKTPALKTTLFDLYDAAHFTVWVEDDLTRIFLAEVWGDPDIRILNASNKEGVKNLVGGAPRGLRGKTVIGLVDLDFDVAPHCEWDNAARPVVTTDVHEFENYLLDFDLLAAIAKDSAANIQTIAKTYAESIRYWMACRRSLRELRRMQPSDFPEDPKPQNVSAQFMTETEAVEYIAKNPYWKHQRESVRNFNEAYFKEQVLRWAKEYQDDLASADGKWTKTFSGKEIFRHIRLKAAGLDRFHRTDLTPAQADEAMAMKIARRLQKPAFEQHPLKLKFDAWKVALKKRVR
ncbi:MAG TPA: hypothetical protein PKA58_34485 [Polyangium sp.]|nr:hypothetical protein [Polyangium sp.]